MVIRIGDHDRSSTTEAKTQDFKVEQITKHSGYSTTNFNNDIGLVKIKGVIKFQGSMRPVCMPEQGRYYFH